MIDHSIITRIFEGRRQAGVLDMTYFYLAHVVGLTLEKGGSRKRRQRGSRL